MMATFEKMRQELLRVPVTIRCSLEGALGIPQNIWEAGHALPPGPAVSIGRPSSPSLLLSALEVR